MVDFGCDPDGGGFNAISKEYKANHTIENYVRLRRERPDEEIEIATTGGIEFLFAFENELRSFGLDPKVIAGLLDADLEIQAEVSLLLLEMIVERNNMEKSGETHVVSRKTAVSDSLINYLIAATLDGMSWNDELEISRELIVLIKHQLGALNSKVETELDTHKNKFNATWIAAQILVAGKTPTYRMIGRAFGVQASTVMRWFPDGNFMSEAKKLVPVVRDLLPGMKKRARELKLARKLTECD